MYYDYFGLKQAPFKITPDTSLFFPGGNRGSVLEALIYAITQGEGIVKVVGEVGTGKTMLCRMLEVELPDNVEVVYFANPSLSPEDILHAIAFELGLNVSESDNRLKVMNALQNYLLERHADNRQIVVFVEEAQGMPIATLEEIRLLSNLETTQNKLLQIVLFGQPELDQRIAKREIRQLKERITYSFQLTPFEVKDIKDYINSRLRTCGYRANDVFSPSAISVISKYSKGLLRRINILADKAMLAAYADNTHQVTPKHVKIAARDSEFIRKRGALLPFTGTIAAVVLVAMFLTFYFPGVAQQGFSSAQAALSETMAILKKDVSVEEKEEIAVEEVTITESQDLEIAEGISSEPEATATIDTDEEAEMETIYLPEDMMAVSVRGGADIVDAPKELPSEVEATAVEPSIVEPEVIPQEPVVHIQTEPESIGLDEAQFEQLKQQLVEIPPEVGLDMSTELRCEKCASMIFRPVL